MTGMQKVPLGQQQSENLVNNILEQNLKPELAKNLRVALFIPNTAVLIKVIKQGSVKTWLGFTENLIKKHLEKSRITTMGNLHKRIQGL